MFAKTVCSIIISTFLVRQVNAQNRSNDFPLNVPIEAYSYPTNKYVIVKPESEGKSSPVIEATVVMAKRSAGFYIKDGLEGIAGQKIFTVTIIGEANKIGLKSSYRAIYSTDKAVVGTGTVEFLDACMVDMIWARFSEGRIIKVTFKLGNVELALDLQKINS